MPGPLPGTATDIPGRRGILPSAQGGTQTGVVTVGDILYGIAANRWDRLGIGSEGQALGVSASGVPEWKNITAMITFPHTLDSHSNVDTTGKDTGSILVWDGISEWQDGTLPDIAGTLANAQVNAATNYSNLQLVTDLDVTGTLDVTGAATFGTAGVTIGTAVGGGDLTVEGNLWLPTIGLIAMGVGATFGQISLDTGAGIGITSPESVTIDIDADNDETTKFFKVRANLTTDLLTLSEDGALALTGNLTLTTGLILVDADNKIDLDVSGAAAWSAAGNVSIGIDSDNNQTDRVFQVYKDGGTPTILMTVEENGDLTMDRSIYCGTGGSFAHADIGNTLNLNSSLGGGDNSVRLSSVDEVRIYLDTDEDTTTADFSVSHGSGFGTLVFNVKEDGQVDVPTGPLIVGTDPTGDELVRVGGTVRIEGWDLTHTSSYDEGFVSAGSHSVATTTGGPVGAGFYLDITHTSGNVAEFYGVDIGAYVAATGNTVTWGTVLEIWGGTDGGKIDALDLFTILSPWGTMDEAKGISIEDITSGSVSNHAIYTRAGDVRFGDEVTMEANINYVDPSGAIGDESYIAFTGGRATFGYYGTNAAVRVYGSAGKGCEIWTDGTRSWYITSTKDMFPDATNSHSIGSTDNYVADVYANRFRAQGYVYVYPWADGTGGSEIYLDGYAGTPVVFGRRSQGSYSSKTATTAYQTLMQMSGQGWDGSAWATGAAVLCTSAGNTWSATEHSGRILFQTRATGDPTTLTGRWQIIAGGDFLPSSDNTYQLGNSTTRISGLHVVDLKVVSNYAIVNPTSGSEGLPTNMTAGLVVREDAGTIPSLTSSSGFVVVNSSAVGDSCYTHVISGTSGYAAVWFGDSAAYQRGGIFYDNSADRLKVYANGNAFLTLRSSGDFQVRDENLAELATTATYGFFRISTTNGTPTGTPGALTGTVPILYDRSNNHLMIYNGGWETIHTTVDGYDEMTTQFTTTSATLVDVTGSSVTITLPTTKDVTVHATFELETSTGGGSTIGVAISGDGTDSNEFERVLSGTNDRGLGAIVAQFNGIASGSRTFKLRARRSAGSGTPAVNLAHLYVHAH